MKWLSQRRRRRGTAYGRIIARLRAWEKYAALRRAGRRVVAIRARQSHGRSRLSQRPTWPVVFIGSEAEQNALFHRARVGGA